MSRGFTADDVSAQTGRTFLVTGANAGLGFEVSRVLAARGAHVILACRDAGKAAAAIDRIRADVVGRETLAHRRLPFTDIRSDQLQLSDRGKTGPMERRGTMLTQRREMTGGTITHVGFPAKAGEVARSGDHEAVAMLLCKDARCRNARMQRIAPDDRSRGVAPARQPVAVDQHLMRIEAQSLDRARHRKEGRLQDVDAVDLGNACLADAPAAARLDLDLELAAALRGELLAVVESLDPALAKQHRRRNHRPGERPASGFVDPDDHMRHGG